MTGRCSVFDLCPCDLSWPCTKGIMVSSDFLVIQSVHSNPSSLNCEVMRMVNVDDSISFHLPSGWPFGISSKKKKKTKERKE